MTFPQCAVASIGSRPLGRVERAPSRPEARDALRLDPATMVDRLHPGVEALGAEAAPLAERLARADDWQAVTRCLDAWLRPIVDRAAPVDGAVRAAVFAVMPDTPARPSGRSPGS